MKRSFFFDTNAADNTGGSQDTSEQLQSGAAEVSTESQDAAEGDNDENEGEGAE